MLCFTSRMIKSPLPPAWMLAGWINGDRPLNRSSEVPGCSVTIDDRKTWAPWVNTVTFFTEDFTVLPVTAAAAVARSSKKSNFFIEGGLRFAFLTGCRLLPVSIPGPKILCPTTESCSIHVYSCIAYFMYMKDEKQEIKE